MSQNRKGFLLLRFLKIIYDTELNYQGGAFDHNEAGQRISWLWAEKYRYTVNKYDGASYIDTKENWFDLKILIPASENVQK